MNNPFDTIPKLKPGVNWWLPEGVAVEDAFRKLGGKFRPLVAGQRWGPGYLTGFSVKVWCERCESVHGTGDDVETRYISGAEPRRLYCTDYKVADRLLAPEPPPLTFAPLPEGESYINPDNIPPEQVGVSEGWRLICTLDKTYPADTQFCGIPDGKWINDGVGGQDVIRYSFFARRTKAPIPTPASPEPAKVKTADKRQPGAWAEIRVLPTVPGSRIIMPLVRLLEFEKATEFAQWWSTSDGKWLVSEANILRNPENIDYLPDGYRFITDEEFAAPAENWPEACLHACGKWQTDFPLADPAHAKTRPNWSIIVKRDAKFAPPAPAAFPELPAGVEWINPEKYTPEQIGVADGWRPLCSRDMLVPDDIEIHRASWGTFGSPSDWRNSGWRGRRVVQMPTNVTYRTKAPIPSAPAPAPTTEAKPEGAEEWYNPGKLSEETLGVGYRFLTVEESKAASLPVDAEFYSSSGKWRPREKHRIGRPAVGSNTYRVKVVTQAPAQSPPSAAKTEFSGWHNPENIDPKRIPAGYRFATVAESKGLLPLDNGVWWNSRFVVGLDKTPETFENGWTYVVPVSWNLK